MALIRALVPHIIKPLLDSVTVPSAAMREALGRDWGGSHPGRCGAERTGHVRVPHRARRAVPGHAGIGPAERLVAYVRRLSPEKEVELAVDAFAELRRRGG
jgi:glycosyltransferase involved in cell wall biosynthesis